MAYPIEQILKQRDDLWNLFIFKKESYNNEAYENIKGVQSSPLLLDPFMSDYLAGNGLNMGYPDNKKFAVCLTHDVDDIYPPFTHACASSLYSLGHLDINALGKQIFWPLKGKDHSPYINFKEIMDIEEAYDARSSFYIMATEEMDVHRFRYHVEDLEGKLGGLVDRGFEVGLHGGYYAYSDAERISQEKKRLNKILNREIVGYRNHYLKFKIPDTWGYLAKCGFKYDATIGNNRLIGFKNGLCHPFKPFLDNGQHNTDIIEVPLVLADFTLFNAGIPWNRLWDISKRIIDNVEKCNGVATLLWHSDVFGAAHRKSWIKLYIKILEYCHSKNSWMTTGEQISNWIQKAYGNETD